MNRRRRALTRAAQLLVFSVTPAAAQMDMAAMGMKMAPDPLGISMNRAGSGSTWTPDAISLPSLHHMRGNWDYMVHGFAFGQYIRAAGPRGDSQFGSLNWGMFMATHELAGGRFSFRTMLSLDPWTVTPRGYPLLLQSGEAYDGEPITDRQHPHDFWMEVAATYERAVTRDWGYSLYLAPSGEPALSPVAFMHRQSAMDNPLAPLGHHWMDATHVTFGVATAGIFTNKWKAEVSVFNGREPDQHRWDFDWRKPDSYSGRLTINPNANWSGTVGYGHLASPEAIDTTESMQRVTGSLLHGKKLAGGQIATTLAFGTNFHHGERSTQGLLESEAVIDRRNTVFGRVEGGTKSVDDLSPSFPLAFVSQGPFTVGALSLGYIREIVPLARATFGIGVMGTLGRVERELEFSYGTTMPKSFAVFVRLRPAFAKAATPAAHH